MRQMKKWGWLVILLLVANGCAFLRLKHREYPVYVYEQPFDLVYLKTYETLDGNNEWVPYRTDKAGGIIEFRSLKYGNWFDLDQQFASFLVRMVDRKHTSVGLNTEKSKCKDKGCLELFNNVHEVLSHLPARKEKEKQGEQAQAETTPAQPAQ